MSLMVKRQMFKEARLEVTYFEIEQQTEIRFRISERKKKMKVNLNLLMFTS
jgi:hypothetical protein